MTYWSRILSSCSMSTHPFSSFFWENARTFLLWLIFRVLFRESRESFIFSRYFSRLRRDWSFSRSTPIGERVLLRLPMFFKSFYSFFSIFFFYRITFLQSFRTRVVDAREKISERIVRRLKSEHARTLIRERLGFLIFTLHYDLDTTFR